MAAASAVGMLSAPLRLVTRRGLGMAAAATHNAGGGGLGNDDEASGILHLVLLLVLGGVLLGSSLEVLLHRARATWLPGSAVSMLSGVVVGGCIRLFHDQEVPDELNFSGTIFFLLILPIILFDMGWSLRKKEFLGSFFTLVAFSVGGTAMTAFLTGGVLYGAGTAGWCKPFSWNEAMAFGSILSASDAASSVTIFSGLGVDPRLTTLVGGEGSLNDAVSIVLYQTFAGFVTDHGADENSETFLGRFTRMLLGSVGVGLAAGIAATFLFRIVHIGASRDKGLLAARAWLCTRRCGRLPANSDAVLARQPLTRGAAAAAAAAAPGAYASLTGAEEAAGVGGRAYAVSEGSSSSVGMESPHAGAAAGVAAGGGAAAASGVIVGGDFMRAHGSIHGVVDPAAEAALLSGAGRPRGRAGEVKPDSSVFSQVSFVLSMAYFSYMLAEAFHLSGVVSVLFCGITLNNFVRPLMDTQGKLYSEGAVKSLAATADIGSFFQVGMSIALTLGTSNGINDRGTVELLGWTLLSILVARGASIFIVGAVVNYFRREADAIPRSWLILLWAAGLRGVSTYAFALVFPTDNRDLLVDVTAAIVMITVIGLGSTIKPLVRVLGIEQGLDGSHGGGHSSGGGGGDGHAAAATAPHAGGGAGGGAAAKHGGDGGSGGGVGANGVSYPPHAAQIMSGGKPYRVFVVSGARVYVPEMTATTTSERTVGWLSRVDARLRFFISGVVRED